MNIQSLLYEEQLSSLKGINILYFFRQAMPFHNKMLLMLSQCNQPYDCWAIDVGDFPSQCKRFSITALPTILAWEKNKKPMRLESTVYQQDFVSFFNLINNNIGGHNV